MFGEAIAQLTGFTTVTLDVNSELVADEEMEEDFIDGAASKVIVLILRT